MVCQELLELKREVRRDKSLTENARLLFAEIADLHLMDDGCFASDATLAGWLGTSQRTILRRRQELEAAGYLTTAKKGNRRHLVPQRPGGDNSDDNGYDTRDDTNDDTGADGDTRDTDGGDTGVVHREIDTPAERESARAHEQPVVSEDRAVEIGQMVGVSERLAREWWLYHDEKGWEKNIRNVKSALRRWKMNDRRFNGEPSSTGDGASLRLSTEEEEMTLDDVRSN